MNNSSHIQLSCNICKHKTDKLYLITRNNRGYLVCEYHYIKFKGRQNEKAK
jgi:hypothetical protein